MRKRLAGRGERRRGIATDQNTALAEVPRRREQWRIMLMNETER